MLPIPVIYYQEDGTKFKKSQVRHLYAISFSSCQLTLWIHISMADLDLEIFNLITSEMPVMPRTALQGRAVRA
jgi:hypothetical protein